VLAISGYSAFWTTPGDPALRTLAGWNIEIMFMFAIAGIWLILIPWASSTVFPRGRGASRVAGRASGLP
jgi:hypothetical protein